VVKLAAGLDARPYRMNLPASLRWVEVDLPEILEKKERLLEGERPASSASSSTSPTSRRGEPCSAASGPRRGRRSSFARVC
jgi:hypothetical protein